VLKVVADLLVAEHAKEFVKYLKTVVPRIVKGSASAAHVLQR
jgi:hypothetical protein